jgi:hypothetical protein
MYWRKAGISKGGGAKGVTAMGTYIVDALRQMGMGRRVLARRVK